MEKRLGIAQLLALVVLMFFVVLTRGSPSSPILSLASQRSATDGPVFPVPSKARRPRSLRDEPLDAFSTLEIRAPTTRERRGLGSGSRGGMLNSANGVLRNTSVKRPYRTSNSITKRPLVGLPMRKNGFEYSASGNPSPLGAPAVSPLSSSAPSESNMQLHLFRRTSRASSPVNGVESVGLHLEDHDLSSSTVTLRGSTPPLYPAAPKNRRSPVETLRRKLKLMQPRRAASLDGANTPETLNDASNKPLAWPSSASDRRKTFNTGHAAFLRDRSETMSSLASEGDEGNSKAWLSTSEDSGDDGHATTPSIGSPSFSDFAKHDVRRSPSRNMPPSPDPSDAETPAANNEALPSTSPAWYPTAK